MWSLPRRNHHRQYMPARNGDHATMCRSDWRSSRNVVQPALPKPQARAFVRRSKPSHRLTRTASSDPSSQTYPPSRFPLSMVDTISARYNASEHQHRTLTIMTDTCGHLLASCVHAANIQDRDGAVGVFQKLKRDAPKLRHVFADCGYRGPKLRSALITIGRWTIQIVKRSDTAEGLRSCPADGSSNAPSPGWDVAADWQRIGRKPSKVQRFGVSSPISGA